MLILTLLICMVCAFVGYNMAQSRRRDPVAWAVICFFTGIIGVIILAVMGEETGMTTSALTGSSIDMKRWKTLIEVDADIADAAAQARAASPRAEHLLAEKYLSLNDKSYLPALLANVLKDVPTGQTEGVIGKHPFRVDSDGNYTITKGAFVGRKFGSYDEMEKHFA